MYWHKAGTQYAMYEYTDVYVQERVVYCVYALAQSTNTVCYIYRCLRATESSVLWHKARTRVLCIQMFMCNRE